MNDEELSIKQVIAEVGADDKTIRRWIKTGELSAHTDYAGRWKIKRSDLTAFLEKRERKNTPPE